MRRDFRADVGDAGFAVGGGEVDARAVGAGEGEGGEEFFAESAGGAVDGVGG